MPLRIKNTLPLHIDLCLDVLAGRKKAMAEADLSEKLFKEFTELAKKELGTKEAAILCEFLADPVNIQQVAEGGITLSPEASDAFKLWAVTKLGIPTANATRSTVGKALTEAATLGKSRTRKSAGVLNAVDWNLKDTKALNTLDNHTLYWIKEGPGRHLDPTIAKIVQQGLDQGLGRKDIGAMLKDALGAKYDTDRGRWDVIASAAMNRSRTFSQVQEAIDLEIEVLEFFAMLDERMCWICGELNGRLFSTESTNNLIQRALAAKTPEEFIDTMPWIGGTPAREGEPANYSISTSTGSVSIGGSLDDVEDAGAYVPPTHGRCRCQLIPSFESVEATRTKTAASDAAAGKWQEPQKRPEGKPLIDMLPQPSLPDGVPTPSQGALESILLPGQQEASFIQATMQVANIVNGWKALSSWAMGNQPLMIVSMTGTESGLSLAVTNTGTVRTPFTLWSRLAKGSKAMASAEAAQLAVEIPLAYEKVSAGAVGIWKDFSLGTKEAEAFGKWMESNTTHVSRELAGKTLGENLAVSYDGLPPIVSWLRSLKPGQINLRWHP